MNLAQLIDAVNISTSGLSAESDVRRYLNEAQLRLAERSERRETMPVTVANGMAALPSEVLALKAVSWDGKALNPWPYPELPSPQDGAPTWYKQMGRTLYLIPRNTVPADADLVFSPRPAALAALTDEPELDGADEVLVAYAVWRVYEDQEERRLADRWQKLFAEKRAEWMVGDVRGNYQRTRIRDDTMSGYFGF